MGEHEVYERLATLEATVNNILTGFQDLKKDVESLKRVVWKAAGAIAVVVALANYFAGRLN